MKPIKWIKAVLCALSVACLGGCASPAGFWDRHQGTQSAPYPDQSYWQDRSSRKDKSREWIEADKKLSRMRLGEFLR
jgi:hypothetical protein